MLLIFFLLAGSLLAVEPGVSLSLARTRAADLTKIRYQLSFRIPSDAAAPLAGELRLRLRKRSAGPLVLDFVPTGQATQLTVNGQPRSFERSNGHLIVSSLPAGEHELQLAFTPANTALNRQAEFLYTLFVPDRASTAFPCFDQPDLKAIFDLTLEIPRTWEAVANGGEISREDLPQSKRLVFAATQPISTYLFAFAAGRFEIEQAERSGRLFRFFHRETDRQKIERNRAAIFDLHSRALAWMEDYTQQPFPFSKFDFVLVPSFQFGGMEHPGAIFYRANSLLLEPSATESQQLARASLISHETAHMWFGDLVTMRWFNDVWTKEVFANFFAAKIVEPSFPAIDHALRFFLAHYPAAYEIDRTAGTHPIRQELDNLNDASSLYGAIIYQKAPIVMDQLERILGPAALRDGLRAYLRTFAFGNATWPELIDLLDRRTPEDLGTWSRLWVESPGRPRLALRPAGSAWRVEQIGRAWPQNLSLQFAGEPAARTVSLRAKTAAIPASSTAAWFAPTGDGYAQFAYTPTQAQALLAALPGLEPARTRAAAWMSLWEALLDRTLPPEAFLRAALAELARTEDELLAARLLAWVREVYWLYLDEAQRLAASGQLESLYAQRLASAKTSSLRTTFFRAYTSIALSPGALERLDNIWLGREKLAGIPLGEQDFTTLALDLALRLSARGNARAKFILDQQQARIQDPERRERFAFVRRALADSPADRAAFFAQLQDPVQRSREPWVLEALGYLNHPLRGAERLAHLPAALELTGQIKATGGIFFPKAWLDAFLAPQNDPAAARLLDDYLRRHPQLNPKLRAKILQSADSLRRFAQQKRVPQQVSR
ncbi:MAG: M1 family aminopeptidase [Bryobacter sp.]|nr:M1 family aminopeptidase [Bryobacter sp.]